MDFRGQEGQYHIWLFKPNATLPGHEKHHYLQWANFSSLQHPTQGLMMRRILHTVLFTRARFYSPELCSVHETNPLKLSVWRMITFFFFILQPELWGSPYWWDSSVCNHLATVQEVTFWLLSKGTGWRRLWKKMLVNGLVRQKYTGNKEHWNAETQRRKWIWLSSWDSKAGCTPISLGLGPSWAWYLTEALT